MIFDVDCYYISNHIVEQCVRALESGGIIIYPTDTLYGVGCAIDNPKALKKLYEIKRRRADKPFSFICDDVKTAARFAVIDNDNFKLINKLIPGAYTFVLPSKNSTPKLLKSVKKTVGIRIPNHIWAVEIVKKLGMPIVTTSVIVDRFMEKTDISSIISYYEFIVDIILAQEDYGLGEGNSLPSTIIDMTVSPPEVIREGKGDTNIEIFL